MKIAKPSDPWRLAMRKCLIAMLDCEGVYFIEKPSILDSRGTMLEYVVSNALRFENIAV